MSARMIKHKIVTKGRIRAYGNIWHRKSSESSFQWTRNIHIDTKCRDHRLICSSIIVTLRLVFIRFLYTEDRCPPLFFDLVNVGKEVSKRLPTVPLVEWRRHDKCTIFVGEETSLNLKKQSLLPIISTENVDEHTATKIRAYRPFGGCFLSSTGVRTDCAA